MTVTPGAHLTKAQTDALGRELDAIYDEVRADLGQRDRDYIHKVIETQRKLELGGRAALLMSILPPAWLAGVTMLSTAKIISNMEIGHNVMHGQWDWMRDPDIHSTTWEWDGAPTSEHWKHTHNYVHHTYTNVIGKDRDLGYTIMRVSGDQPWNPVYLAQPLYNVALAATFEWAVALYDLEFDQLLKGKLPLSEYLHRSKGMAKKVTTQSLKDYVVWPLLSGISAPTTVAANLTSNIVRNVWAHTIIFCGHFPDGGATFAEDDIADESRGEWYLRQMEGSCNIEGGPLLHLMSGNLSYQIEHHIFPDLPSNRYKEIAPRVREICDRYGIPYSTGPLHKQYGQVLKKIVRFAFPGGAKSEQREVDPQRASQRNPRAASPADSTHRGKASGVRAAAARESVAAQAVEAKAVPAKRAAAKRTPAKPKVAAAARPKAVATSKAASAKPKATTTARATAKPKPTTARATAKPKATTARATAKPKATT
ncbi:MAG: fatty acid desaturase, partial [Patulibacter sp.]|nr:fatty acid desaturase [Patulibacter sp.]